MSGDTTFARSICASAGCMQLASLDPRKKKKKLQFSGSVWHFCRVRELNDVVVREKRQTICPVEWS